MGEFYNLTPREIVAELDKYIVGQDGAKNRWRSLCETDTDGISFPTRCARKSRRKIS